jgi:cytochrome c oxidase accessory protein FixG
VQVCPTGIDIRKGLQYECISCAACIDVCDDVMDKVGYPKGLIRYSTEHALAEGWSGRQILRHVFRPRVLMYSAILGAIILAFIVSLFMHTPFKVDVVRDRAVMARMVPGNKIENLYRLQIMNARERQQTYTLSVEGLPGLELMTDTPDGKVTVEAAQSLWVQVRLQAPYDAGKPGSHPIEFHIQSPDGDVEEKSVFIITK